MLAIFLLLGMKAQCDDNYLKFDDKNGQDYGIYLVTETVAPTLKHIIVDMFIAKKCTHDGKGFKKFIKENASTKEYFDLLSLSQENRSMYYKKIEKIRRKNCTK